MGSNKDIIRRSIKDSVFRCFFSERENVLDLYKELHPEDRASTVEDIRIRTVERALETDNTNKLGFTVGDRLVCLMEFQSHDAGSFQLRTLLDLAEAFRNYLDEKGLALCELGKDNVPTWEAYVVSVNIADRGLARLSQIPGPIVDGSKPARIPLKQGGLVQEYIDACGIVDALVSDGTDCDETEALMLALDGCEERCGTIGSFIRSRRWEIRSMYKGMLDEEAAIRRLCKESERRGVDGERSRVVRRVLSSGRASEEVAEIVGIPVEDVMRIASEPARRARRGSP